MTRCYLKVTETNRFKSKSRWPSCHILPHFIVKFSLSVVKLISIIYCFGIYVVAIFQSTWEINPNYRKPLSTKKCGTSWAENKTRAWTWAQSSSFSFWAFWALDSTIFITYLVFLWSKMQKYMIWVHYWPIQQLY